LIVLILGVLLFIKDLDKMKTSLWKRILFVLFITEQIVRLLDIVLLYLAAFIVYPNYQASGFKLESYILILIG